ncbi:MAG: YHYH protein [Phycisphaeraceae bacterium]
MIHRYALRGRLVAWMAGIVAMTAWAAAAPRALAHEAGQNHHHDEPPAKSHVTITTDKEFRYIKSDGLPDHDTGEFPNRGNPNKISKQEHSFRVPLKPKTGNKPTPIRHALFGVAVNGVVFDPGTAEFWRNDRQWNYEALSGKINLGLDDHHAHVQPTGAYHYHGLPTGLIKKLGGDAKMVLVGYAADGFPIYGPMTYADADDAKSELRKVKSSYRAKEGDRPSGPGGEYDGTFVADYEYVQGLGDLDECNGRTGVTPEYPDGTYYYVLTEGFPFVPRMWRGEADASFQKRGGPGGPARRGRPDGRPDQGQPPDRDGPPLPPGRGRPPGPPPR